jgi:hypothetical protein
LPSGGFSKILTITAICFIRAAQITGGTEISTTRTKRGITSRFATALESPCFAFIRRPAIESGRGVFIIGAFIRFAPERASTTIGTGTIPIYPIRLDIVTTTGIT